MVSNRQSVLVVFFEYKTTIMLNFFVALIPHAPAIEISIISIQCRRVYLVVNATATKKVAKIVFRNNLFHLYIIDLYCILHLFK
jgi:hypothetical protein